MAGSTSGGMLLHPSGPNCESGAEDGDEAKAVKGEQNENRALVTGKGEMLWVVGVQIWERLWEWVGRRYKGR